MNLLKKIPLFLFLLVLFFCLHGTVENYGYVGLNEVLVLGGLILAGMAILFGIIFLFARNYLFAALVTFFISLWYLFFGALQDWILRQSFLSFLHSYSVLLPVLLISTIAWIIFLKRKKSIRTSLAFYLNILLLIYCAIDGFLLIRDCFTAPKKLMTQVPFDNTKVKAKPNVYFLLFDEYPGYASLKGRLGYANDSLYNYLQQNEFKILPTFSNYDYTLFSMSSILNMQYVKGVFDPLHLNQHDYQLRTHEIRDAAVVNIFASMGYQLQNYSIFDIKDQHSVADQNSFLPVHSQMLTDKILHNRFIRTSGWIFQTGRFAIPSLRYKYLYQHDIDNKYAQKMLLQSAAEKNNGPKFCYAHFLMPHAPFYQDSTGKNNPASLIDENAVWPKELFLSYLKYSNGFIRNLLTSITTNDPNAIVILMSDHGFRHYDNVNPYDPFNYDNICALRLPGKNFLPYKDKWSTVNFFRYLFNCEYGQNMPYLADSSIVLAH